MYENALHTVVIVDDFLRSDAIVWMEWLAYSFNQLKVIVMPSDMVCVDYFSFKADSEI